VHITTDRLILRRLQDRDLQDFLEYEQHPDHSRYFYRRPYSEEQAKDFIAENRDLELGTQGTYLHLAAELTSSGKMIGTVCVNVTSKAHRKAILPGTGTRNRGQQGPAGVRLHPARPAPDHRFLRRRQRALATDDGTAGHETRGPLPGRGLLP